MEPAEQIKLLRKTKKMTQADFAKFLNVSTSTIAIIESGSRDLPKNLMKTIATKMNIAADWLLTGEGKMFLSATATEVAVQTKIPLLSQKVSCGSGQEWQQGDNIESYIEPMEAFPALHKRNVYAFRAHGVSMTGLGIQDGDILFFDGDTAQTMRDDVYVFGFAGDAYCKLLRFEPLEGTVRVYSCQARDIREAELIKTICADSEDFQIFGRVICWMHENRIMCR